MADLAITAADVAPVRVVQQLTGPAAEEIKAGQVVRLDTTTGYFTLANATSATEGRAIGVAISSAAAGETITVVKQGIVDFGSALNAEDYDESLLLSDNDGALDDGDGSPTGTYVIGRVVPGFGSVDGDRLFMVEL